MEFGKSFTYQFADPDWIKKIGIAALLSLIPILGLIFVAGWGVEITRRVIQRASVVLPDWTDFGSYFAKGLQVLVIGLVYALPVILISACIQAFTLVPMDQDVATTAITVLSICISCVSVIYGIVIAFMFPAALGSFAVTGKLNAAFRLAEVFGLVRAAPVAYLLVFAGSIAASVIASLGILACVIGVFFTGAYASTVNMHLIGQAYNAASDIKAMQNSSAF